MTKGECPGTMTETPRAKRRPIAMLATGTLLLLTACWFNMANIHYTPETAWFPFRTAGWFGLGGGFCLCISLGYAYLFALLSRRTGRRGAWGLMLIVSAILALLGVRSALPARHLRRVLGERAAAESTLEHLQVMDSFNDGRTYVGKVTGPATLVETVAAHRELKRSPHAKLTAFKVYFEADDIPERGEIYEDRHTLFYRDATGRRLYFIHHSRVSD